MSRAGLALIEVMIALVLLAMGILVILGGAQATERMVAHARAESRAVLIAEDRLEQIRLGTLSRPSCVGPANGGAAHPGGFVELWRSSILGNGFSAEVVVQYPRSGSTAAETLSTVIACP